MEVEQEEWSARDHAARLAAHLFLVPENVARLTHYWVSQYSAPGTEQEHFLALVAGLLQRPPALYVVASQGVSANALNMLHSHGLVQFAGTETHRLPLEVLARAHMQPAVASLAVLEEPRHACFATCNADGLDGELELTSFAHDDVLAHFFEPALLVLALYLHHLTGLRHATCSEVASDWAPRHLYSLGAINEQARADIACCAGEKLARTRRDLAALHAALDTPEFEAALQALQDLWAEKAAYCWQEIAARDNKLADL